VTRERSFIHFLMFKKRNDPLLRVLYLLHVVSVFLFSHQDVLVHWDRRRERNGLQSEKISIKFGDVVREREGRGEKTQRYDRGRRIGKPGGERRGKRRTGNKRGRKMSTRACDAYTLRQTADCWDTRPTCSSGPSHCSRLDCLVTKTNKDML